LDLVVDYDDFGSQDICNLTLDTYNKDKKRREGTAFGLELIRRILDMFDCNKLSDILGNVIYVIGEGEGLSFKPKGFERPLFDNGKKLIYKELFDEYIEVEGEI
jgi:hypothetical protein